MSKKFCAVAVCKNTSVADKSLSWHRFPKSDEKLRNKWIRRCGRSDPINLSHSRVCSAHFAPEAFERNFKEELMGTPARRYLKPNAIPTLNLKPYADDYCEETAEPDTKKRKRPTDDQAVSTANNSAVKVIAKSKRTCKLDGQPFRTEEIVFEVDEPDDNILCDDDDDDEDNDNQSIGHPKINGREPEKGIFECSLYLTDDEDDVTMFKNEITIPAGSSKAHTDDPTSDYSKIVINGGEQPHCSTSVSNIANTGTTNDLEPAGKIIVNDIHNNTKNYPSPTECKTSRESECISEYQRKQPFHQTTSAINRSNGTLDKLLDLPYSVKAEQIEKLFTPNQLKSLMKPKKRIHWTDDEIFEAIKLRFFSLPMYSYLRNKKGYPFPGRLAISRWAKKMKLRGGTLHSVLKILELGGEPSDSAKTYGMKDFCVLSLGEMEVQETIEYDEIEDEIIGPYKRMQVMVASSLTGSWQQPVFVDFDCAIDKDTVMNMIVELYNIGYYVVCFSCDCSDASVKLWDDLGASLDSPCFPHPVKGGRIVVMPDALHAIRLIRDNLLDGGFEIEGSVINRTPLDDLLDLGVCSKLRPYHLQPTSKEKRRTDLAAQLVSSTIGAAVTHFKPGDAEVAKSTGNFFKVMSHWFDLMNVGTSKLTVPFRSPYGYQRSEQDKLLEHVKTVMYNLKCAKNTTLQSFQIGIIMSCNGLSLLLDEAKKHFKLEYITTRWLNHTLIDNIFSSLCCEFSQVPTPVLALDRLQSTMFGANLDCPPEKHSVFTFVARRARIKLDISKPRHSHIFESITPDLLDTIFSKTKYITDNNLSRQCLNLIAEKINLALEHKYPQLCKFSNLCEHNSDSHEPTAYFFGNLVKMEKVFVVFTRGLIAAECKNILAHLTRLMKGFSNSLPVEVIKIFVRLRIEIYARSLVPKLPQLVMKRRMHAKLLMALKENVDEQ